MLTKRCYLAKDKRIVLMDERLNLSLYNFSPHMVNFSKRPRILLSGRLCLFVQCCDLLKKHVGIRLGIKVLMFNLIILTWLFLRVAKHHYVRCWWGKMIKLALVGTNLVHGTMAIPRLIRAVRWLSSILILVSTATTISIFMVAGLS